MVGGIISQITMYAPFQAAIASLEWCSREIPEPVCWEGPGEGGAVHSISTMWPVCWEDYGAGAVHSISTI